MMMVVIIVQLWVSMGTSFLTLCAGFNTVDRQYYEAGSIDGIRNRFQELWFITLPMMAPHLMLSAVLAITATFSTATVATVMTGFPSTNYATHTIMHHLQDYGTIRYERGYASAIATVLFLFSLGANKLAQKLISRIGK
jgi:multiple sugar transport system permease protein